MNRLYLSTSIFLFALLCLCSSCGKEDPIIGPTSLNSTNNNIYELLPAKTIVSRLSTNITATNIRYLLVAGEGDTHNQQFETNGDLLRTKTKLNFTDGPTRSIRIRATDGVSEYETALTINVQAFEGTYPIITSPSFENNGQMPRSFGADNGNISPDFDITNVPTNTGSMALIMRDLDDGGSIHWAVWNIPPDKTRIFQKEVWGDNVVVATNAFGDGYVGPFPPSEHRYETSIYFFTEMLPLGEKELSSLLPDNGGKLIAQSAIIGKYKP